MRIADLTTGRADVLSRYAAIVAGTAVPLTALGRAALGVAVAFAAVTFLASIDRRQLSEDLWKVLRSPVAWAVIAMFAAWLPSVLLSFDPGKSSVVWLRMWLYLGIWFIVWNALRRDPILIDTFLKSIAIAAAIMCLILTPAFFGMPEWVSFVRLKGWTSTAPTDVAKEFGSAATCMIPIMVLAAIRLTGRWRILAVSTALWLVFTIIETDSKAGIMGLSGGTLTAAVMVLAARRATWVTGLAATTFAAAFAFVIWFSHQTIDDYMDADTYPLPTWGIDLRNNHEGTFVADAHREAIWLFTLQKAREAPFFGHGIDAINKIEGAHRIIPAFGQEYVPSHPHSWLIEILAETGWVGLLALVVAQLLAIHGYMRRYAATRDPAVLAAVGIFVGFWTSSLFNFSIWSSWWQVAFLVMTAVAMAAMRPVPERAP